MRRAEQITCFFWIFVSLFVCTGAVGLKVGTPSDPGPGFLPFGTGALLGLLSVAHLLKVSVTPFKQEADGHLWMGLKWQRSVSVAVAVLFYALLLPHLGYLITTFLLMAVLFSLFDRRRWGVVVLSSILVIAVTYLVFHVWLKVQFPAGFFRIG
jgi:putative tricarboxylic transport membrane protein